MAIEARRASLASAALAAVLAVAPLCAQRDGPSLLLIDADTRVASVDFRFDSTRTLEEERLRATIGLQAPRGLATLGRTFAWLPFISPPALMPFEPVAVQRDKIRLTRLYEREGFPAAQVAYEVRLDTAANTVGVTFAIDEGPPRLLESVRISADGGEPTLPADLEPSWRRLREALASRVGARLSEALRARIRSDVLDWLRSNGYAFAEVETVNDEANTADLLVAVDTGPRARVGQVIVTGHRHLTDATVARELPFKSGDPFRSGALAEGQRELFGLDLVRLALVDVAPDQPRDSTADVLVRLNESSLRAITGRIGYASQTGLSTDANWENRNFLGDARTLRLDALARTGLLATGTARQVRYGGSVTLKQPYLGDRRVSGLLTPSVEFRDDLFDRSTRAGFDATVLWERGSLRRMSLGYGFSVRAVGTARGGAVPDNTDLIGLLRAIDSAGVNTRASTVTWRATWGRVDNLFAPGSGWVARVGAEFAGPAPISTVEYGRLEGSLDGYLPLGGATLIGRVSAGRLLPFGRSAPAPGGDDEIPALLRLRDVIFTAGGTADVRGWSPDLLGPKVPDFDVTRSGDSIVLRSADRYVPLGGLARFTASVELRVPMPLTEGRHDVFGFLDGGRVWLPDDRFVPDGGLGDDDGTRFRGAAGAGLQFATPVGPLRIAAGYKLNPSALDLRDPGLVGDALLRGDPPASVPEQPLRRWHVHLSIGGSF